MRRADPHADALTDGRVFARFGGGQAAVTMDRGTYYQTSYLIEKGRDAELRARDIQWLRDRLGALFDWDDEVTAAIGSWDDVKLLEVTFGRLRRWYRQGLLCLGDAAHTMSPVGGVGVNLALQDAVAAARILAAPLRRGTVGAAELARVQKRRQLPVSVMQRSQRAEHTMIRDALAGDARRRSAAGADASAAEGAAAADGDRLSGRDRGTPRADPRLRPGQARRSIACRVNSSSSAAAASRSSSGCTSQCAITPSIAPPIARATVRVSKSRSAPACRPLLQQVGEGLPATLGVMGAGRLEPGASLVVEQHLGDHAHLAAVGLLVADHRPYVGDDRVPRACSTAPPAR